MMTNINDGLVYVCPHCDYKMQTDRPQPDKQWHRRDPRRRYVCENCGRFAIPEAALEKYRQNIMQGFEIYSNCPNAAFCQQHEWYDADCEQGVVMQRCFQVLNQSHNDLGVLARQILRRVDRIEKQLDQLAEQPEKTR